MVDIELLKEKITTSGMTVKAIAEKSTGEFTASEIVSLTKVLRLSKSDRDKIFLNEKLN